MIQEKNPSLDIEYKSRSLKLLPSPLLPQLPRECGMSTDAKLGFLPSVKQQKFNLCEFKHGIFWSI